VFEPTGRGGGTAAARRWSWIRSITRGRDCQTGPVTYPFLKGHGTENDFVLLPDHDGSVHGDLSAERVRALCDRRAGIGADGVLRVVRSSGSPLVAERPLRLARDREAHPTPEWFMDYRNADGSVAEMCGNGIRVFAQHLYVEGLVPADEPVRIATRDGVKTVTRHGDLLRADLGPATILGDTLVSVDDRSWPAIHVTMGNPHAVVMVDDLAEAGRLCDEPTYDVVRYPDGVNVEFVARLGADHLAMRVHERGSGETRSCGTGACAAAVAAAPEGPGRWRVDVPGGTLEVTRDEEGRVHLGGPALIVACGETDL
jgi:diaminopimelate epimerase